MGRATTEKREQIQYLQNRFKLLSEMAHSLEESATVEDLHNLTQQVEALTIKINRFKKDWQKAEAGN